MAIIKCPECGHQISDRAPVCPSCGVEIAGRVISCPQCGEVYFSDQHECPRCHHANATPAAQTENEQVHERSASQQSASATAQPQATPNIPKTGRRTTLIVSLTIALLACAVSFYFYTHAQKDQEQEAYEFALDSNDPIILQDYLDRYRDASPAHRDSVQVRLTRLQQIDIEWTNTLVSNSKSALEQYLQRHPDTPHREEAMYKIDSLDWIVASGINTADAYRSYLEDHPNGRYADQVKDAVKQLNAQTVQPEERQLISTIFRQFFESINAKDEDELTNTVNSVLTSFLGKSDASKNDVVTFLHKLYNDNVASMTWRTLNDYKIDKKEIGQDEYEYTVNFSANQEVEHKDDTRTTSHYRIKAKVNPDGKITEFNMTRIIE